MAYSDSDFGFDDPNLDHDIGNDDYNDDDEQEADKTRPFRPFAA